MGNEHIATYLNDHLAGSVVALELLEHLEAAHDNTPLVEFFLKPTTPLTDETTNWQSFGPEVWG